MRNMLAAATGRIAALEEANAALGRDLNQVNANLGAHVNQTAQMMTTILSECRKSNDRGCLNHSAAKNVTMKQWSGVDDREVTWRDFKRSVVGWSESLAPGAKELLDVAEATDIGDAMDFATVAFTDEKRNMLSHALFWNLSTKVTGAAANHIQGVAWSDGLAAWQELCSYAAPRSLADRHAVYAKLMSPKEAASISTMAAELAAWERELDDFETRFEPLRSDEKITAAKAIIPKDLLRTRLLGVRITSFQELRATMRAIGLDRAIAAREEAAAPRKVAGSTKAAVGDPMDVGELVRQHQEGTLTTEDLVMAMGSGRQTGAWRPPGKGSPGSGKDAWTVKGDKGNKGGGKNSTKGGGKGKTGKGHVTCFNCGGKGHYAQTCSSEQGVVKSINEVAGGGSGTPAEPEQTTRTEEEDWHQETGDAQHPMLALGLKSSTTEKATKEIQNTSLLAVTGATGSKNLVKLECTLDSGCVDHVFPRNVLQQIEARPSRMSKAGDAYVTATAEPVPNLGEKVLQCRLAEGHQRSMVVQVADVSRPLLSASRLNDTGNSVELHPDNPRIKNLKTGEESRLRRVGKMFILDLWVEVPAKSGFPRP